VVQASRRRAMQARRLHHNEVMKEFACHGPHSRAGRGPADVRRGGRGRRLAHSYLLVGPDGVGKRLFARELAKAFLCEKPPAKLSACDACPSCAQVEAETHPDLLFLRTPKDKHELPVDDMREFCSHVSLKPTRGPRKIGIVEDADDFNASSANSFLKTLEEPPPGALLLLLATTLTGNFPLSCLAARW